MWSYCKKCISVLLLVPALALYAQEPEPTQEPEIVIELTGQPDSPVSAKDDIAVWEKDTAQLTKLLRGKTREEALYKITSVSSKDVSIQAADGTRYRFVQYGREGGYRKLLFLAKDPQLFIACASTTKETIDLTAQYQVGLGLTETEFLENYPYEASAIFLPINNDQTLYKLNLRGKTPLFLLFEQHNLTRVLTPNEANRLIHEQNKIVETRKKAAQATPQKTRPPLSSYKAIVEGGTLHDQLYMPRVVTPAPVSPAQTQDAQPSTAP